LPNEWTDYFNFFIPSVKLIEKKRVGSKIKKIHDGACTPYHRLKEQLKTKFKTLNPFQIQSKMMVKIKVIMKIVNEKNNMKSSLTNMAQGNILL